MRLRFYSNNWLFIYIFIILCSVCLVIGFNWRLWLCVSCQSLCNVNNFTVQFVSVEPKEIVSINEKIVVYFKADVFKINDLTVTFHDSLGASILCLNSIWTPYDPLNSMVNCTTGSFDNFTFGSPLDLETTIFCGNTIVEDQTTANVSTVIDPQIVNYTKYVFMGEQSYVELDYVNIHEKHINSTSLSYKETICSRVSFENKAHLFKCSISQFNKTKGSVNGPILDFVVSLIGRYWRTLKLRALPMPTIEGTFGLTFAGALNPIFIIGTGFSPLFASQLYLMTSKSKIPNKCSYFNETYLKCIAAHGLAPVNLVTQVNFTLLLSPDFNISSTSTFTQNRNPFIISADFSFSEQILTLLLYNYVSYYQKYTAIEIFDAARKEITPCRKLKFTSVSTLTCEPVVHLSPDYPYNHHVTLKISSWQVTYKCINCSTSASSYSKTFIVVGILSALLLSIVTSMLICNQLEISNTLSVFKPPPKPIGKPLAMLPVEPPVRPLAKPVVKPLAKSEVDPLSKSEVEPISKSEVKPADKSEVDVVFKTLVKPLVKTHIKR